ncbi:acyl-CoA desaturase [Rhodococcus rhodnii]|uniref:Fatty acid desaturase n=2 Tax=Rhodococcus rhodnii TaxID=38312 RepID=R7WJC7_9NOCA|nr:acyl-CoA desaturase [Rhodococcus rhodnii]EOM75360.1 fatty acid desaturase [Rhodococcus rhodnii LMG 5362]TXG90592.1 acyl-CoA desaturase [Rhodococcus rhodnii]
MAITDIKEFAHLTASDIEALGDELDSIRREVESSLGVDDARYIRRTIQFQRVLELLGRAALWRVDDRTTWAAGTALLSLAKIVENMELGHNVMHGQWDWMNDPEIHSVGWEWDQLGPSEHWKRAHNYSHHTYTNVVGMDDDIGFGVLRMTRDVPWRPVNLLQPVANIVLALTFEWGIAIHDRTFAEELEGVRPGKLDSQTNRDFARKMIRQLGKDFVLFPALSGRRWRRTLTANLSANVIRNIWAYLVIFCGHFPDGAEKFTVAEYERETRHEWYLRQMLGSANFRSGRVMGFLSGNLSYQIEHHLFPDLPSNRLPEVAKRVRALCEKYDLPYTTGSLAGQYVKALRTIHTLALPDRYLRATSDDARETSSERKFRTPLVRRAIEEGRARGLASSLEVLRQARRRK